MCLRWRIWMHFIHRQHHIILDYIIIVALHCFPIEFYSFFFSFLFSFLRHSHTFDRGRDGKIPQKHTRRNFLIHSHLLKWYFLFIITSLLRFFFLRSQVINEYYIMMKFSEWNTLFIFFRPSFSSVRLFSCFLSLCRAFEIRFMCSMCFMHLFGFCFHLIWAQHTEDRLSHFSRSLAR